MKFPGEKHPKLMGKRMMAALRACYRDRAGNDTAVLQRPAMAIVILGGLVTSTLLNRFVLPTLALRYGRFGEDGKTT